LSSRGIPERYLKTFKKEATASKAIVVTNNPLASSAGIEILARGGNAFDAAVASLFALTVVEPMMVSMFGAGYFIYRDAKERTISTLDNYAVAPLKATETMYKPVKFRKPEQYIFETEGRRNMVGYLSSATPGALKGWEFIVKQHGKLGLRDVMLPAIRYARDGFHVTAYMNYLIRCAQNDLATYEDSAKIYLPGGHPISAGEKLTMKDYSETLEAVSKRGSDHLYKGDLGQIVVEDMKKNGGLLTMQDLANYELVERSPVSGTYRDEYDVYSIAPGSSGGTHIIQMLNMLENFDIANLCFASVEYLHLLTEILKITFADRQRYMGDPSRVYVPIDGLTSKKYAAERLKEIEPKAKNYNYGESLEFDSESRNTTHVSVVDSEGNMVAATQTLFSVFGSAVVVPGTGMLLNNCMGLFDPRPGRANSVEGGKRMLSSMSPTLVLRKGKPYICIGTPGGTRIFPAICQALVNIIDFGMSIQQAVEAPRLWTMGIKDSPEGKLQIEPDFDEEVFTGLRKRGHDVVKVPKVAGGMNGILVDDEGVLHGGACWRADGSPIGISGGEAASKALVDMFVV
jgi:gamma-glutamyltranspeptidase/glutathione hydrolase